MTTKTTVPGQMTTAELAEAVELLLSVSSFDRLYLALRDVAKRKDAHLREKWQDGLTADKWHTAAAMLTKLHSHPKWPDI